MGKTLMTQTRNLSLKGISGSFLVIRVFGVCQSGMFLPDDPYVTVGGAQVQRCLLAVLSLGPNQGAV